jgi:pimeloyl-ACP methyl ester carboxylesterase
MSGLRSRATTLVALLVATISCTVVTAPAAQAAGCGDVKPAPLEIGADGAKPVPTPHPDGRYTPILLIHGFISSPATWSSPIRYSTTSDEPHATNSIIGNLQRLPGGIVFAVDYRRTSTRWFPKPGGGGAAFTHVADCVSAEGRFQGHRMIVVGHSMGGLIARWAVTDAPGAAERAKHVGLAVTIGTPFEGSWIAAIGTAIADSVAAASVGPTNLAAIRDLTHALTVACEGIGGEPCETFNAMVDFLATAHAFVPGSPELKALSPWPDGIRVHTLTSSATVTDVSGLFLSPGPGSVELGDVVVGRESATTGAFEDKVEHCQYTMSSLRVAADRALNLIHLSLESSQPRFVLGLLTACFHIHEPGLLEHSADVTGIVADQLARETPGYAYLAAKEVGVVHGAFVTDRMAGSFSGLRYTDDGRFVLAVDNAGKQNARISAIDLQTGRRRDVACGGCVSAAPAGGGAVVWLDQAGHVMKADLSGSAPAQQTSYRLPPPVSDFGLAPPRIEATQAERLFVSEDLAPGASVKLGAVTVLTPDGNANRISTENVGRIVASPSGLAVESLFRPANCPSARGVYTLPGTSLGLNKTDLGTLGDSDRLSTDVADLWWGRDGKLYATMSSRNCDYDDHTVLASGLYRLEGNRWRVVDEGPVRAVRKLTGRLKAVVLTNGILYTETDGKGVEVARDVTAIEMPPGVSDPAATVALLPPPPAKCPTAEEFRTLLQRYYNGQNVKTSGPSICQDDWAYGLTAVPIPPFGYSDGAHTLLHRIDGRWLVYQSAGTGPYFFGLDDICDKVPSQIKSHLCRTPGQ